MNSAHAEYHAAGFSVFHEDPVRVLRGVRFAVDFKLEVGARVGSTGSTGSSKGAVRWAVRAAVFEVRFM